MNQLAKAEHIEVYSFEGDADLLGVTVRFSLLVWYWALNPRPV